MATPLSADQIIAALRKWGIPYRELPGWRTWNRNAVAAWGPVYGFGVHHTGDDAPDSADRRVVHDGRTGLPGPLAQFGLNDDGVVDLIGCGRANHFGGGDPNVLRAVQTESYGAYPPASRYHEGSPGAVDGNTHFYGVETYYSGAHTPAQYAAMVRLAAAILDAHGWSAKSVIGHKEWSDWKVDPGAVDMATFRRDVQVLLDAGPGAGAVKVEGDWLDMASNDDVRAIVREELTAALDRSDLVSATRDAKGTVTGKWTLTHVLDWIMRKLNDNGAKLDGILRKLEAAPAPAAPAAAQVPAEGTYTLTLTPKAAA